tara:strand:- start:234 stop:515 length:282 start_codon:yes stop_codon:yes gene_type:complete
MRESKTIGDIYVTHSKFSLKGSTGEKIFNIIKNLTPKQFIDNGWKVKGIGRIRYREIVHQMCVVDEVYDRRQAYAKEFCNKEGWSVLDQLGIP